MVNPQAREYTDSSSTEALLPIVEPASARVNRFGLHTPSKAA